MKQPTYIEELSEAQRAAVLYDDGAALVIAGAGSGKTRVLVAKLLHLLDVGYAPSQLMALTFTNKASQEMRERMATHVGYRAIRDMHIGTFHSVFRSLLKENAELLGFSKDFQIYDSGDSLTLIKRCIRQLELDPNVYGARNVQNRISGAKNRLISASDYAASQDLIKYDSHSRVPRVKEIYALYQSSLRRNGAMDFDDLLFFTNELLRDHPDVRDSWRKRISFLLIDEYQDTNFAQYLIALQLMGKDGKVFAVGDDSQSIYSFRGANIENILHFKESYPSMRLFKLEENYRSTRTIVEVAGRLIRNNHDRIPKEVYSQKEQGEDIEVKVCLSNDTEATWVASAINDMHHIGHINLDDIAVLYRTNAQSRLLEEELRKKGVPFRVYGAQSFFSRREVKDVLAYLRLTANPNDDEAFLRSVNNPKRGIGDTTLNRLQEAAREAGLSLYETISSDAIETVPVNSATRTRLGGFANLIRDLQQTENEDLSAYGELILRRSGLRELFFNDNSIEGVSRQENIKELLNSMAQYQQSATNEVDLPSEGSLADYLSSIALLTDQSVENNTAQGPVVSLMTIHAAKGLEFPHIYIVGVEEQLLPSSMCSSEKEIEEERRLLYVAITRAMISCRISYCKNRYLNGRNERRHPSRFIQEIYGTGVDMQEAMGGGLYNNFGSSMRHGGLEPAQESQRRGDRPAKYGYESMPRTIGGRSLRRTDSLGESAGNIVDTSSFTEGMLVVHKKFGQGTIITLEDKGQDSRATVLFDSVGQKVLLLRFAKLTPLENL